MNRIQSYFFEYKTLNQQNITIPTNKSENDDE